MRELPRLTVRAPGRTLAVFAALTEHRQVFEVLADVLRVYVRSLPAGERGRIMKRARVLRRERYADTV